MYATMAVPGGDKMVNPVICDIYIYIYVFIDGVFRKNTPK